MWPSNNNSNNNSIFGSSFNQNRNQTNTSNFSSTGTGLFSSFNSNRFNNSQNSGSSIFGSSNQNQTQNTSFFNSSATNSTFPSTTTASGSNGTGYYKFNTISIRETSLKGGMQRVTNNRSHVIVSVADFKDKSLVQLRVEDYAKNLKKSFDINRNQATGIFGSSAQNQSTGFSFGNNNLNSSFGSTNNTSSIFGNTQNTRSTGLFGNSQTSNNSTNLFGNTQTSQPKTSIFGSSATNTNTQGNSAFSFGNSNLSSTNKPATSNTGSLFGSSNTQNSIFGASSGSTAATAASSGGLFNKTSNSAGGLFGKQPINTTSSTSGSLFGSTGTNSSTTGNSAFGNSGSSLFGSSNTSTGSGLSFSKPSTGLFSSNPSTFGSTNTSGGFSFGSTASNSNKLGGSCFSFSSSQPTTNTGNLFGQQNNSQSANTSQERSNNSAVRKAILTTSPYNQLKTSQNSIPIAEDPFADAASDVDNMKKSIFRSIRKTNIYPEFVSNIKITPVSPRVDSNESTNNLHRKYLDSTKRKIESSSNDTIENNLRICDSQNLSIDYKNDLVKSILLDTTTNLNLTVGIDANINQASMSQNIAGQTNLDETEFETNQEMMNSLHFDGGSLADSSIHPARIVSTRPDYYTVPTLEELANMTDELGTCITDTFIIGREGYGCLKYNGPTDVSDLNIDRDINFKKRAVSVYPNASTKPSIGEKLNKECTVELHNIFPSRQSNNHIMIKLTANDQQKFENKLRKMCMNMESDFISYDSMKGIWTFKVNHFSIYGFDEDVENSENDNYFPDNRELLQPSPSKKSAIQSHNSSKSLLFGYDSSDSTTTCSENDQSSHELSSIEALDANDELQSSSLCSNLSNDSKIQCKMTLFDKSRSIIVYNGQNLKRISPKSTQNNSSKWIKLKEYFNPDLYVDIMNHEAGWSLCKLQSLLHQSFPNESEDLSSIVDFFLILFDLKTDENSTLEDYLFRINFRIMDEYDPEQFNNVSLEAKIKTLCTIGEFDTAASIIANNMENPPLALIFLSLVKMDSKDDHVEFQKHFLDKPKNTKVFGSDPLTQAIISMIFGEFDFEEFKDFSWSQILSIFITFKRPKCDSIVTIIKDFLQLIDKYNYKAIHVLRTHASQNNEDYDNANQEDIRITLLRIRVGQIDSLPRKMLNYSSFSSYPAIGNFGALLFSSLCKENSLVPSILLRIAHQFEFDGDLEMSTAVYLFYIKYLHNSAESFDSLKGQQIKGYLLDFIARNRRHFDLTKLSTEIISDTFLAKFTNKEINNLPNDSNIRQLLSEIKSYENFLFKSNIIIQNIYLSSKFDDIEYKMSEYTETLKECLVKYYKTFRVAHKNEIQQSIDCLTQLLSSLNKENQQNRGVNSIIKKITAQKVFDQLTKEELNNYLMNNYLR
ncbi:MAG: Nuclear pore complex protein Nup98-Nup96 [Marteilia pararefringens]